MNEFFIHKYVYKLSSLIFPTWHWPEKVTHGEVEAETS